MPDGAKAGDREREAGSHGERKNDAGLHGVMGRGDAEYQGGLEVESLLVIREVVR